MINKVVQIADIHIRKSTARHTEYREVFKNLYKKLSIDKPDRIVIVGDLFHDYIKLEGEVLVLSAEFLNSLTKIANVIITRGNHDIARSAPNRLDSVDALVKIMNNPKITYLNKTDMFDDDNVVWAVWKHGDKRNNPWPKDFEKVQGNTYIDLFHDPINTSTNADGYGFNSKTYRSPKDFLGDISMFGDIHLKQYLDTNKTKAYSSSLIQQNFAEGDDQFHGYLLWNWNQSTLIPNVTEVSVDNPYGHYTLDVNRFTDFDNLQLSIKNGSPNKRIRIKWKTLPAVRNTENQRKVDLFLEQTFSPISIKHVNDFIEEKKIKIEEQADIENISKREVVHKVLSEYLTKIGVKGEMIKDILELDVEIEDRLDIEDITNIQWSILKLKGKNFRSYEDIEIDWIDRDGLYQIVGDNGVGKSTVNQLITYILFGKSLETDFRKKFGDARFINNKLNVGHCEGSIVLEANGEYYGIKRTTIIKKNKEGELTAASTTAAYYKLNNPTDKLDEEFNIEKLNEIDKSKTQERINEIIGSYENFIRVTLTTSDTLNNVLSSDKALFIDSLLFDSGLNIFDMRLKEFKKYKDELIHDNRLVNFNANEQNNHIIGLNNDIKLKLEFIDGSNDKIKEYKADEQILRTEKDSLSQSMHQIDPELSNTNEIQINSQISKLEQDLLLLDSDESKIKRNVDQFKKSYDANRLDELNLVKDNHKTIEFEKRTKINKKRLEIEQHNSAISSLNGKVELLMKEGSGYKTQIKNLTESSACHACGQSLGAEHEAHIKQSIKELETVMFDVATTIRGREAEKPEINFQITKAKEAIVSIENEIQNDSIQFQLVLEEMGRLANDKIEVEKRERLLIELSTFPIKRDNINLRINEQKSKLKRYVDQKTKIQENQGIKLQINTLSKKIDDLTYQIDTTKNSINTMEAQIRYSKEQIKLKEDLIAKYVDFEYKEEVRKQYAEAIHRDGLPTQILVDTLLPNINNVLSKLLESTDFDVYLDREDLRLKFFYNDHPNAIIDCISASGMERTFAVYALKIALNQINSKSKSTLLTVDEIMGKLKNDSVDKFIELLHLSKKYYKKILIIEPSHEVNADYLFVINKNKDHISKLIIT